MLSLLLFSTVLTWVSPLLAETSMGFSASIVVKVSPAKVTLFAGEVRTFAATVFGTDLKDVTWAVEEENGGSITPLGQYTAPKIQGVYHITAISKVRPQSKAVAIVTVLAYCDPLPPAFRQ